MWNMAENFTPQRFSSGSEPRASFQNTPARWYIFRAISASRLLRNTGQVSVLGLKRAKSSAVSVKWRSGSRRWSIEVEKNAKSAGLSWSIQPRTVSRQNL